MDKPNNKGVRSIYRLDTVVYFSLYLMYNIKNINIYGTFITQKYKILRIIPPLPNLKY